MLRRHLFEDGERFVLHDVRSGALLVLDRAAFAVALAADGTRDVSGIAVAAARSCAPEGLAVEEAAARGVLHALASEGLLLEGPRDVLTQSIEEAPPAARPIERLPYLFRCDALGHCCEQYASIPLTRDDLLRARRAGLAGGDGEHVVLPLRGNDRAGPRFAMTLREGRCLQLMEDQACGLHVRGGEAAKPAACDAFPATLVDDGLAVRLTPGLECACVFTSLRAPADGDPASTELLRGVSVVGELRAGVSVRRLPEVIAVNDVATAPPAELSAWSREETALVPAEGVPAHAAVLGRRLEKAGLERSVLAMRISDADVTVHLAMAVRDHAQSFAAAAEAARAWRSPRDRTRVLRERLAAIAADLHGPALAETLSDESHAEAEAFALRAVLFGHQLVGGAPLSRALVAFGAELVIARRAARLAPELGHSIAAVRATVRGG